MHDSKFFKILVLIGISSSFLLGFEDKFSEKNQTGTPKIKKEIKTEISPEEAVDDSEELLTLDSGPISEDRKKFEAWYGQLQDQIRQKKEPKDRLTTLHQGLVKLEKDREQLQNLNFNEEIEIDFLIKPLKILPKDSQFKVQDCPEYKLKILSHFDPTSEEEVKDPSLKKAINVFKLICTN